MVGERSWTDRKRLGGADLKTLKCELNMGRGHTKQELVPELTCKPPIARGNNIQGETRANGEVHAKCPHSTVPDAWETVAREVWGCIGL